jgi:hypothetical protein
LNYLGRRALVAVAAGTLFAGCPEAHVAAQQKAMSGTSEHEQIYKCDAEGARLDGILTQRMFYGPPGFGETPAKDLHDKVLILKLAKPITVEPIEDAKAKNSTNLRTLKHVRQVQLFFHGSKAAEGEARKLLGKTVVVVGALDEATAPRQYTDVTVEVTMVNEKEK